MPKIYNASSVCVYFHVTFRFESADEESVESESSGTEGGDQVIPDQNFPRYVDMATKNII